MATKFWTHDRSAHRPPNGHLLAEPAEPSHGPVAAASNGPVPSGPRLILWSIDKEGVLTSGNSCELHLLGGPQACPIGRSVSEVFRATPELIALAHQAVAGTSLTMVVPANGALYDVRVEPLRSSEGAVEGAVFAASATGPFRSVEREVAEMALRYRSLVESVPAIFYMVDPLPPYSPQYVSAGSDLLGYTIDEWLMSSNTLWLKVLHPDDRQHVLAQTENALATGEGTDYEYRVIARDGSVRWLHDRSRFVRDASGRPISWQGVMLDITARKEAEAALRSSEARYRMLFEESPLAMWVYDAQSLTFLAVNQAALEQYGYSRDQFLTMTADDVLAPDYARASDGSRATHVARTEKHLKRDGSLFSVQVTSRETTFAGRPAHLVLAQDVSAQEILEAQLRQSQKMESIGRLAGGIAHDFNNLLTVITCYSEGLLQELTEGSPAREDVLEILAAAGRASSLTSQLLAFGRKQLLLPRVVGLSEIVRGVEPMLRRLIGENIKIATDLSTEGLVRVDVAQIEQVLMNLAVNARDAMPNGGVLTIEVTDLELDCEASWPDTPAPGRYVRLAVRDTGTGMDAATLDRAFEPFFTTKEVGMGTGLGLATVYGIVKQSGGNVRAFSTPGCGASFEALLPCSSEQSKVSVANDVLEAIPRGSGTVLLVEDEDEVREVTARSLRALGYTVLVARQGLEALQLARVRPAIDLVVTDVVMPELGGLALAERLTAYVTPLRILFLSGYTNDATMLAGMLPAGASFLQKPFSREKLARAVFAALRSEPTTAHVVTSLAA